MHACALIVLIVVACMIIIGTARRPGADRPLEVNAVAASAGTAHDRRPTKYERNEVAAAALDQRELLDALVCEIADCIETRSDYAASVRLVDRAVPAAERDRFILEIVRMLKAMNPDWAANFTLALPLGAARYAAIDIVAEAFGQRGPAQALQWAQGLPNGATRSIALERIVGQMAAADLAAAAESLAALPASLAQDEALCSLASHWARRDARRALDWAINFPDGPLKPRVLASVGFELAQSDPVAATRLAESVVSPADRAMLLASIRWSRAGARAEILPDDPYR